MATSPLHPASDSRPSDRILDKGHGTHALGPSDSSDNGSDLDDGTAVPPMPDGHDIDADRVERIPGRSPEDEDDEEDGRAP